MNTIDIVLHINFKRKEKAISFINRWQKEHDIHPQDLTITPYTKFENQFRVSFTLFSNSKSDADRTFELLILTDTLIPDSSKTVNTIGPSGSGEDLSFETIVNAQGIVEWANLQLAHA